ncbi:MAG TPA: BON domain-containing protein, partial [Xanthobacteraceae bacterium]|nr:BON domain-containing protein [Xanthobacteraceae bacterium]
MGLISFVKSAGEKLFGASEAKAATPDALQKELEKHGLDTSGVKITVDGDKVHVTGSAPTTEQAEKIAVALGNTVGVQTV